MVSVFVPSRI